MGINPMACGRPDGLQVRLHRPFALFQPRAFSSACVSPAKSTNSVFSADFGRFRAVASVWNPLCKCTLPVSRSAKKRG